MNMIEFRAATGRFALRVAGVALHHERVLLCQLVGEGYWFLPGGRANLLETTEAALKREMQEELATPIHVGRLLWIVENFFQEHYAEPHHELGFYYLMRFPPRSPLYRMAEPFRCKDEADKVVVQWHSLSALPTLPLYPVFLRQGLVSLPAGIKHVSIKGRELAA
jgi:ADP-ribose pyrophosphatase YjhB (NUDIX family)